MRNRLRSIVGAAILAGFIGSCNASSPAGHFDSGMNTPQPPIRTDKSVYTVQRGERRLEDGTLYGRYIEFSMRLEYTNPTDGPIYLPTCNTVNPPHIEKVENQGWVMAFAPVVQACLGPPVIIQPGRSYQYTYNVEADLPGGRAWPQFQTEIPGRYRLVWSAYRTWTPDGPEPGLGIQLPKSATISNEFELQE
jgi:hypothetical protein